jgi:hypothetical protein
MFIHSSIRARKIVIEETTVLRYMIRDSVYKVLRFPREGWSLGRYN